MSAGDLPGRPKDKPVSLSVDLANAVKVGDPQMTGYSFSPDGIRVAVTYGSWSSRPAHDDLPSVAMLYSILRPATSSASRLGTTTMLLSLLCA